MRNKIKEFLERQPDSTTRKPGTSAYRFWKDTKLSRPTAYRLVADPTYIPTGDVLDKICSTYCVQPGDLLVWTPAGKGDRESSNEQNSLTEINQGDETIEDKSLRQRQRTHSFLTVVSEVPESA